MALSKQPVNITFGQGLDTKTDPNQVPIGKFLTLVNSVFTTGNRLTKRNGYNNLTAIPNALQTNLTTLNDNLIATGSNLWAYSQDTSQWLNKGLIQPVELGSLPMVRNNYSQISGDAAIAANGLTCLVYEQSNGSFYKIIDSATGQEIVTQTLLLNATSVSPRAFLLGKYFVILYLVTIGGSTELQYITIPVVMPTSPNAPQTISTTLTSLTAGYDGYVANNNLYVAWADTGSTVVTTYLTSTLIKASNVPLTGTFTSVYSLSVTADLTQGPLPVVWVTFIDENSGLLWITALDSTLVVLAAPRSQATTQNVPEVTTIAAGGTLTIFQQIANDYVAPYPIVNVRSDFIRESTATLVTFNAAVTLLRSVGLASKPFIQYVYTLNSNPNVQVYNTSLPAVGTFTLLNQTIYLMAVYGDTNQVDPTEDSNQPTYFLIDSTGAIYMRLAYSNGGGYEQTQVLPSVSFINNQYLVPYLLTDFLATTNKGTNLPTGTPVNTIYTQTGINLANFTINDNQQYSSEIAGALHLTGGQLWEYDGVKPVEHGFHVWPENVANTTSGSGGLITANTYFYVFTYEWTDNAGNLHRSAPSIPLKVVTTGSTSTVTLYVPNLRLTYKIQPNPVRIVGYRWSTAQQIYYQFTSLTVPTLNDPSIDFSTIVDTQSDAQILGNVILYTTGGVVEDIAAPASVASTLFKSRLFLIDAEDRNLLWYSKQVIENTPVEMSDLFTIYVAPTSGAQGSTGPMTALSAMDDKLIIFKRDAIYYITGNGPDITGANNDFSDPIFITSSVGCTNPNSIVLMKDGLMFQSDKGIWLLGRDLSTIYIGAAVEAFNNQTVHSAQAIPGTNQVRFVVDDSVTLMYDYFYSQWGTFTNIQAISSTLYQNTHTYLNEFGAIFQETPGTYLDGSRPVLMSFTTSWISLAGLQGYERFYYMLLLGTYYTPFNLNMQMSYDYNPSKIQNVIVQPDNFSPNWGDLPVWGSGDTWGGPSTVFSARVFPQKQKCETFQITLNEVYDSSLGAAAGQGLSLSGLNLVVGVKKGFRTQSAKKSFG